MSDPKPVELTEAEKADLIDAFQDGYLMSADPMTSDLTQLGIVVTRIKTAARREALLEAQFRLQPPPPWPASDKKVANDRGYAAGWCDALAVVEELRAKEGPLDGLAAKIARVKALADGPARTDGGYQPYAIELPDGIHLAVLLDDLRAALAEPTPDDAPCSCGSRDATSLTPGERLHHSPDRCTIERGGEDGR